MRFFKEHINIFLKIYNMLQTSSYVFGKSTHLKSPSCNICFHEHEEQWFPTWSSKRLKLRGHVQHFSSTRSKKMLQHFFSENVTRGAYLQHAAILDFCSKKMLQHLCSNIKSVWYCCNSFATFLMFCSTIFLSAAYFLVAHMCSISLQQILLWFYHRHMSMIL